MATRRGGPASQGPRLEGRGQGRVRSGRRGPCETGVQGRGLLGTSMPCQGPRPCISGGLSRNMSPPREEPRGHPTVSGNPGATRLSPPISQARPPGGHVDNYVGPAAGTPGPVCRGPRPARSLQGAEPPLGSDSQPREGRAPVDGAWGSSRNKSREPELAVSSHALLTRGPELSRGLSGHTARGSIPGTLGIVWTRRHQAGGLSVDHGSPSPFRCGSCRTPGCGWMRPPRYSSPCPWPLEDTSLSPATTSPGRLGLGLGATLSSLP